jgi:hypothetical protein
MNSESVLCPILRQLIAEHPAAIVPLPAPMEKLFSLLCHSIIAQQLAAKAAAAVSAKIDAALNPLTP